MYKCTLSTFTAFYELRQSTSRHSFVDIYDDDEYDDGDNDKWNDNDDNDDVEDEDANNK